MLDSPKARAAYLRLHAETYLRPLRNMYILLKKRWSKPVKHVLIISCFVIFVLVLDGCSPRKDGVNP